MRPDSPRVGSLSVGGGALGGAPLPVIVAKRLAATDSRIEHAATGRTLRKDRKRGSRSRETSLSTGSAPSAAFGERDSGTRGSDWGAHSERGVADLRSWSEVLNGGAAPNLQGLEARCEVAEHLWLVRVLEAANLLPILMDISSIA